MELKYNFIKKMVASNINKKSVILYLNVIELHEGWGAEYFMNQGFLANGDQTITIDYRKYRHQLADKLLAARDFDVFFLQRGDNYPLQLLKAVNRPKFFWSTELVARCRDQDRLFKCGLFDHVFVHTEECRRAVINRKWLTPDKVSVFLPGFDQDTHKKYADIEKDIDILHIGVLTERRTQILEELKKDFSVKIEKAYGEEMAKLFNRAKIVLNIHGDKYIDTETRIFEALGCGAFVISEKLGDESPVTDGEHLVEVSDIDGFKKKIRYYLSNENERDLIATAGHEKALIEFTCTAKAKYIADFMGSYSIYNNKESLNRNLIYRYKISSFFLNYVKRILNKLRRIFFKL